MHPSSPLSIPSPASLNDQAVIDAHTLVESLLARPVNRTTGPWRSNALATLKSIKADCEAAILGGPLPARFHDLDLASSLGLRISEALRQQARR
jgi:hypothetical protein